MRLVLFLIGATGVLGVPLLMQWIGARGPEWMRAGDTIGLGTWVSLSFLWIGFAWFLAASICSSDAEPVPGPPPNKKPSENRK